MPRIPWRRYTSIQVVAFLNGIVNGCFGLLFTDYVIYHVCISTLTEEECKTLHYNSTGEEALDIERLIQPTATKVIAVQQTVQAFVPAIVTLFVGPWSDIVGRKPALLFALSGKVLTYFAYLLISIYTVNAYFILVPVISISLSGGETIIIVLFLSYIFDTTSVEERAHHVSIIYFAMFSGFLVSSVLGPVIYDESHYSRVFLTCVILAVVAVVYLLLIVPESKTVKVDIDWRKMLSFSRVAELFKTMFIHQDGYNLWVTWSFLSSIFFFMLAMSGNNLILYLYASARFGWDVNTYANYVYFDTLARMISLLFIVKLVKTYLGISDTLGLILFTPFNIVCEIVRIVATESWYLYLAAGLRSVGFVANAIMQSALSQSAASENIGKLVATSAVNEHIAQLLANLLYGEVYPLTLNVVYPSLIWFLSLGCYLTSWMLLIGVHVYRKRTDAG